MPGGPSWPPWRSNRPCRRATAGVSPSVPLSIGVHTGPVVVGGLGAESQRLYTAVGETLELASRLRQQAAPGAILLSAATQQLVQAEVQVDDGGTLGVAGEAAPGPVYQVRGIARRRSGVLGRGGRALSRFVGRERELAMLHERLHARHPGPGAGARPRGRARHRQVAAALRIPPEPGRAAGDLCRRALSGLWQRHAVSAGTGPAAPALWHRRDGWPRGRSPRKSTPTCTQWAWRPRTRRHTSCRSWA